MARTLKEANQEIVVLKAKVKELEELTLDALTGLPQRKVFQLAVEEEILRCQRTKKSFSILVIDLNYLKTVNDEFGHPTGDLMLTSFAKCLRAAVRGCDIVARTGGDEFMVFLPGQNAKDASIVKKHLLAKFEEGRMYLPFFNGAAIGVATFGKEHPGFQEMYKIADTAMYKHKKEMKKCA